MRPQALIATGGLTYGLYVYYESVQVAGYDWVCFLFFLVCMGGSLPRRVPLCICTLWGARTLFLCACPHAEGDDLIVFFSRNGPRGSLHGFL